MDESDTSPAAVSPVLDKIQSLLGMTSEEWMPSVRVFDYDGGTSADVEGLKRQRYPSNYDQAVHANPVGDHFIGKDGYLEN